ncbi:MAG: putative metal-binding motif-containing protein, partial [Actinomycetota bacterium]
LAAVPFLQDDSFFDQRTPTMNTLAGQARFNMSMRLFDNRQVQRLRIHVRDDDANGDVTAFLYRYEVTTASVGPRLMARLDSAGAVSGVREFVTDTIVGRTVDNARYFYYAQFYMGLNAVQASGLQVENAPCGDNDGDGFDGCVDDCNDLRFAVRPGAPEVCDGVLNDCSNPFWPDVTRTIESDDDFDGFSECQGDCNDADPSMWSPPGEVLSVQVTHNLTTGATTITWSPPGTPGSTAAPIYDTLLSFDRSNFNAPSGVCAETNGADLTTVVTTPAVPTGQALYFLVRAEGACGQGTLGTSSGGATRTGRTCP